MDGCSAYGGLFGNRVAFRVRLDENGGWIDLEWSVSNDATGERREYKNQVELVAKPQPFGGRRWWFICPTTGRLTASLYLPPGASAFASRQAHRLTYPSQRHLGDMPDFLSAASNKFDQDALNSRRYAACWPRYGP
jgi:hypothetical protein